jgi:hypothetical protein
LDCFYHIQPLRSDRTLIITAQYKAVFKAKYRVGGSSLFTPNLTGVRPEYQEYILKQIELLLDVQNKHPRL